MKTRRRDNAMVQQEEKETSTGRSAADPLGKKVLRGEEEGPIRHPQGGEKFTLSKIRRKSWVTRPGGRKPKKVLGGGQTPFWGLLGGRGVKIVKEKNTTSYFLWQTTSRK